eukprot:484271_1
MASIPDKSSTSPKYGNYVPPKIFEIAPLRERVQSQIGKLQSHIGNLESALFKHKSQIGNLESHTGNLESALFKHKSHIANLEPQIGNLESALFKHKSQIGNLESHIGNLESALFKHKSHIANLEPHIGNLESALFEHKKLVKQLQNNINSNRKEIQILKVTAKFNTNSMRIFVIGVSLTVMHFAVHDKDQQGQLIPKMKRFKKCIFYIMVWLCISMVYIYISKKLYRLK